MIKVAHVTTRGHSQESAQVLSVLTGGDDQWVAFRGARLGNWLAARGITHGWCFVGDPHWLVEEIRGRGASVILAEAQSLMPHILATLATALPHVRFVTLLHGAPSWCASSAPAQTYDAIRLARDLHNVFVGVVSTPDAMAWLPGAKVVHLPNPIETPDGLHRSRVRGASLCVSLIARPSPVKNWGGMLAALGLLSCRRDVTAVVAGRGHTPNHQAHLGYLRELHIDALTLDFGDWEATLQTVAEKVDVGLACGYSDALNLVAAEHCLLGIPVVGSPVLDWLPEPWRVSPQDPVGMADAIEALADDGAAGDIGRELVCAMVRENETTLLKNLHSLLRG